LDTLTHQEIVGVQVHEVLHVVFKHHLRRGKRDKHYWNCAGDYIINAVAKEGGFILPEGALFNPDYAGMSTEKFTALFTMMLNSKSNTLMHYVLEKLLML